MNFILPFSDLKQERDDGGDNKVLLDDADVSFLHATRLKIPKLRSVWCLYTEWPTGF